MLPTNPLLNATAPAGPHLPVALLRQYAAGTLAPAAQHRVEAHTLACPRCADILEGFLQTPAATTDQALAQLQQRLRKRVQQPAPAARPLLGQRQQPRWLAPQLAAAATLLLGLVAGGWWTWQQRHADTTAARPVAAASSAPQVSALAKRAPTPAPQPPAPSSPAKPALAPAAQPLSAPSHFSPRPPAAGGRAGTPAAAPPAAPDSGRLLAQREMTLQKPAAANQDAAYLASAPPPDTARSGAVAAPLKAKKAASPALSALTDASRPPAGAMPAAPALPPAPVGGYPALRDKLRREAAEFVPEAPERPLSGSVQLRLTIGADGKIQQVKVLRGLRADYDAEAQELVCDGPAWVPGISGGRRAAQVVDIAVPF